METPKRCISCEIEDALQSYHLNTVILAAARLIVENYQPKDIETNEKNVEDCKLALLAVSSTAPDGCENSAIMQTCTVAIYLLVCKIYQ